MPRNVSTVTRKGQITIPIEIRRRLGIQEGDLVEFTQENGTVGIVPLRPERARPAAPEIEGLPEDSVVRHVFGIAAKYARSRPLSLDEMKAAAALGWTKRERRFQEQSRLDDTD
jgi:AbrB family looped-hinge helix DNA binding protein